MTEVNPQGFEITTCSRCGGSGEYSYNTLDGTRCYGCGGCGKTFTPRGHAAHLFYIESQKRPAVDVKVGDFVWDDTYGKKARWLPVLEIDPTGGGCTVNGQATISFRTARCSIGMLPTSMVRSIRNEAHRLELLAAALAFQAEWTPPAKAKRSRKAGA
jgi:hypothetical protein